MIIGAEISIKTDEEYAYAHGKSLLVQRHAARRRHGRALSICADMLGMLIAQCDEAFLRLRLGGALRVFGPADALDLTKGPDCADRCCLHVVHDGRRGPKHALRVRARTPLRSRSVKKKMRYPLNTRNS